MARTRRPSDAAQTLYARLGTAIEKARSRRGLTQTHLGKTVGEAQTTISDYEQAKTRVPLDAVVAIEDALGLARGHLLVDAGYVPASDDPVDLIERDPTIDDNRREYLLEMYQVARAMKAGEQNPHSQQAYREATEMLLRADDAEADAAIRAAGRSSRAQRPAPGDSRTA